MNLFLFRSMAFTFCGLLFGVLLTSNSNLWGQGPDLSHRKSNLTISVEDTNGNPMTGAAVDVMMTNHTFKFGTQIRDRFYSITETEFNSLTETQKQWLLPDLTQFGTPRYTPTWQDALNYRAAVSENFNHVIPTVGMQWSSYESNGTAVPDAAFQQAQNNGLTVTGASVVWQRDQWPTPTQFQSAANPLATTFHDALIADRLGLAGIMARFSDTGAGPTINDWKVLNEPIHENYHATVFVNAGIYATENHALADYFIRADALRPNATLWINEFNILNSLSDADAEAYRDLVNDLLALGAPIHRIGVQAHMSIPPSGGPSGISKQQITDRLDILAQTGLPIEFSEFDMRDDADPVQLTANQQKFMFRIALEAAFEHESVDGFNLWGFWDPGHWRGNGPLFDDAWNIKDEAFWWFNYVRGEWMTELTGLTLDGQGSWSGDVFDGTYEFLVTVDGQTLIFSGYELTEDMTFVLVVPPPPGDLEDWQFDDTNGTALNAVSNTGTTGTAWNFGGPQTQNGSLNIGDANFFKYDVGTGQTFRTADFTDLTAGAYVFEFVIADWDLSGSSGETGNGIIFKVGDKDDGIMNLEFEVAQSPGTDIRVRSQNSNNGSLSGTDAQNQLGGNDLGGASGTTASVTVQLLADLDTGIWSTRVDAGSDGSFVDLVTDGTGMNSLDRIQLVMDGGANGWEYGGVGGTAEDFIKIDSVTLSRVGVVVVLGDANGDGVVDFIDVSAFLEALFDRTTYNTNYPGIDADVVLDINLDGVLDFLDVTPFLGILFP